MKRFFFFISFLMCMVMHIMAYQAMVVDGYSWNVVGAGDKGRPDIETYNTYKEKIDGDSVIDGVVYKKLWRYLDANAEDRRHLLALVREDVEEQKVFAYSEDGDVLLYDLGVAVGDTIKVWNNLPVLGYSSGEWYFSNLVVDFVEVVEDATYGELKKVTYHKADKEDLKATIYERYGATTGWFDCGSHAELIGGETYKVICAFDENDELVLKRDYKIKGYGEVKDCYVKTEINTAVDVLQNATQNIFYDTENRVLSFDIENPTVVSFYDAMGRLLHSQVVDESEKQMSLDLAMGIYVVRVKNDCDQMFYSKIVVR